MERQSSRRWVTGLVLAMTLSLVAACQPLD